ncbi:hypothetical protein [Embleya sp. AB8]|uniref:hypothetical protein n=1 Tax=Embleya sp. AB8 TaxID=3156304 RepID=UPI003C792C90
MSEDPEGNAGPGDGADADAGGGLEAGGGSGTDPAAAGAGSGGEVASGPSAAAEASASPAGASGDPAAPVAPLDVEPPGLTGVLRVDGVLVGLGRVGDLPTEVHGSVYEDVHRGLREALAELDR